MHATSQLAAFRTRRGRKRQGMWHLAVRAFVITSMVLNGALVVALITAVGSGYRAGSILDLFIGIGLLLGFLNAVGDLIEAERPVIHVRPSAEQHPETEDAANRALHIIRSRRAVGGTQGRGARGDDSAGLDAFSSER